MNINRLPTTQYQNSPHTAASRGKTGRESGPSQVKLNNRNIADPDLIEDLMNQGQFTTELDQFKNRSKNWENRCKRVFQDSKAGMWSDVANRVWQRAMNCEEASQAEQYLSQTNALLSLMNQPHRSLQVDTSAGSFHAAPSADLPSPAATDQAAPSTDVGGPSSGSTKGKEPLQYSPRPLTPFSPSDQREAIIPAASQARALAQEAKTPTSEPAPVKSRSSRSQADAAGIDGVPEQVNTFLTASYEEAKQNFDAILDTLSSQKEKLEQALEKEVKKLVDAGFDETTAQHDLWRITAAQHHITTSNESGSQSTRLISVTTRKKPEQQVREIIEYTASLLLRRTMPYFDQSQADRKIAAYYQGVNLRNYHSLNTALVNSKKSCQTRLKFWSDVERQSDGFLRCAYTNKLLETSIGIRFLKCNEEHVTPQSWHQGSASGAGTNLHNKFGTWSSANGSRGNKAYDSSNAPKFNQGAVARTTLCMFLQHQGTWHHKGFNRKNLDWLIKTAQESKPTLWEKARNERIASLQGVRNPFIDFPELIHELDASFFYPAFSKPLSQ